MASEAGRLASVGEATVEFLAAVLGLLVVFGVPLVLIESTVDVSWSSRLVRTGLVVLAVGGSYPFVAGNWSLARLWEFVMVFWLAIILGGLAISVFDTLVGQSTTGPATDVVHVTIAYGIAVVAALTAEKWRQWPQRVPIRPGP